MPLSYTKSYLHPITLPGHAWCLLHETIRDRITALRQEKRQNSKARVKNDVATLQILLEDIAKFINHGDPDAVTITQDHYGYLILTEAHSATRSKPALLDLFESNHEFYLVLPRSTVRVRKSDYARDVWVRFKFKLDSFSPVMFDHKIR